MNCRPGCGACCVAPSMAFVPGMDGGKPAGVSCIHLTPDRRCRIFGRPERPGACERLRPSEEMCGRNPEEALAYLAWLERETAPETKSMIASNEGRPFPG